MGLAGNKPLKAKKTPWGSRGPDARAAGWTRGCEGEGMATASSRAWRWVRRTRELHSCCAGERSRWGGVGWEIAVGGLGDGGGSQKGLEVSVLAGHEASTFH